jgi:hypothetical protein
MPPLHGPLFVLVLGTAGLLLPLALLQPYPRLWDHLSCDRSELHIPESPDFIFCLIGYLIHNYVTFPSRSDRHSCVSIIRLLLYYQIFSHVGDILMLEHPEEVLLRTQSINNLALSLAFNGHTATLDQFGLHDVLQYRNDYVYMGSIPNVNYLIKGARSSTMRLGTNQLTANIATFRQHFNFLSSNCFVDAANDAFNWSNVCVAGGSVLASILFTRHVFTGGTSDPYENSDIDIFTYGMPADMVPIKLMYLIHWFLRNRSVDTRPLIVVSTTAVSILFDGAATIQIILSTVPCIASILHSFDIPACQVAYDGNTIVATDAFKYAVQSRTTFLNHAKNSSSYIYRLIKYAHRSFSIVCSDLVNMVI